LQSGTTTIKYLEENFAAKDIELSAEETAEIREAISNVEIHGTRYPDL
jgi:aryl-alcohol dehydrogenase-like predicted oxidoreductase